MFTNSDGTHDKYDSGFSGNLKDNQWHDVMIRFEANKQHGLKYYVDGVLTYSDPTSYKPISNQTESQSPRYGIIGNGSEMTSPTGSISPNNPFKGWIKEIKMSVSDKTNPTVILTDSSSNQIVKNSDAVLISANFSESLITTPTVSISGLASNVLMSATNSPTN